MSANAYKKKCVEKFRELNQLPFLSHRNLLLILIALSLLINSYFSIKLSLWHDEAITANAAISFLQNNLPNFQSGFEYWRSFPHTLLVATSGYFFGISDFTLRIPSVLLGSLTIALTYIAGKELFDRDTALIASAFLTFSAWQVAWASQVRMYAMFQFLYLMSIYLIYLAVERKEKKYILALILSITIAIRTHVTGQILPFIATLYWFYRNRNSNFYWKIIIPLLALVSIVILELSSIESFFNVIQRFSFNPENIYLYYELVFKKIPILSLLGFSGCLIAFKKNLDSGILTALAVFPAIYIYIIHVNGVDMRYVYFSAPFFVIWTGLSIKFLSTKISDKLGENTWFENSIKFLIILMTISGILIGSGLNFNFSNGEYRVGNDEESVYSYIKDNGNTNNTLITQWTPSATYYYKAPDYALYGDRSKGESYNSTYYRDEYDFNGSEIHSGAKFIDSDEELIKIINENEKGWIVLRGFSYWKKSNEIRNTISELEPARKFTKTDIEKNNELNVWRWNKSIMLEE